MELIKHYISLYEGAYLIKTLEKYSPKSVKVKSSSPKIIPLAPALVSLSVRSRFSTEERGRAFEALVGAQLVRTGEELFYWREGHSEVDFVLKKGRSLWGIEVKSGRKKSVAGLDVFKKKFPSARTIRITFDNYERFEKAPMDFLEG